MLSVWRALQGFLPPSGGRSVVLLALESFAAGAAEAALLVLLVGAALAIANEGSAAESFNLPVVGLITLSPGHMLVLAALAGLQLVGLHLDSARISANLSAGLLERGRHSSVSSFAAAGWAQQAQEREGSLQELVSTLSMQSSLLVVFFAQFIAAALALIALLVGALLMDTVATLIVIAFGGFLLLVLRPVSGLTRRMARDFVAKNSAFSEGVTQWGSLAMELRIFGVERAEADRLLQSSHAASSALRRTRFVSRAGALAYRDVAILALVGAMAGLHLLDVEFGQVGAVMLLVVRALSYAQQAQASRQQVSELTPNLDDLKSRVTGLGVAGVADGATRPDTILPLELQKVSHYYEPGRVAIDEVSLRLERGEIVGVVGPSGGGKTSLVQVILRLLEPSEGQMIAAGVDAGCVERTSWYRHIGGVPQEPRLFQGTVAENIAFFRPLITSQDVERAAELAHILDDIRRMPEGFKTRLGPRGAGLSGGQRQRITIARALAGMPELLVFDEPTSALDVVSENLIQRTIAGLKGSVTMVIVAHRVETLAACDRVIAMRGGRVVANGPLNEALQALSLTVVEEKRGQ